ncbi:hypothetical protein [Kribbella sp. NPDC050470]|uniref:hypothetical protein n=1 Tax=unclassified Kribbella TaxID=2644121 RepID=UPI0037894AFC
MNELRAIVDELPIRPRMYLPDGRYASLVAFLDGHSLGTGDDPLKAFGRWLADQWLRRELSWHWGYLVAAQVRPSIRENNEPLASLSAAEEADAADLLQMLTRFLVSSDGPGG